jgi:hypothetical protein
MTPVLALDSCRPRRYAPLAGREVSSTIRSTRSRSLRWLASSPACVRPDSCPSSALETCGSPFDSRASTRRTLPSSLRSSSEDTFPYPRPGPRSCATPFGRCIEPPRAYGYSAAPGSTTPRTFVQHSGWGRSVSWFRAQSPEVPTRADLWRICSLVLGTDRTRRHVPPLGERRPDAGGSFAWR